MNNNKQIGITAENIDLFSINNLSILKTPVKGIIIEFHGLNYTQMNEPLSGFSKKCAELGIIHIFPYYGPWSWMNINAVKIIDTLVDTLFLKYNLDENIPLISTGGSMGGQGALIYSLYAKRTPTACAANSPVCDLLFHYNERDDLPRTIYSAFSSYDCGIEEAIKSASPYHMAEKLPLIDYYIVHGDKDSAVNKALHSDVFVKELIKSHNVIYDEVKGMEHCALDGEHWEKYENFILSHII